MTESPPEHLRLMRESSTLVLLRRLLDVGGRTTPAVARKAGLTTIEMHALDLLARHAWGPAELARHLGVTSAAASGIVDRLVARGHVERQPHAQDRRRTQVRLTESARAEALGHLAPMFAELARVDAALSDEDRVVVDRYLADATRALERLL